MNLASRSSDSLRLARSPWPRWLAGAFAVSAFALASSATRARAEGFELEHFEPSERGSDWFANESLDLRGNVRPAVGLVLDWAHRPLVVVSPDGDTSTALVENQVLAHLGGSLVLADRFRVGIDLPIAFFEDGNGVPGISAPSSAAVGDLRLAGDVRLLGTYGDVFTLALGAQVWFPTGSRDGYVSDGTFRIQPRALVAGDIGPFTYAAKVAFEYRPHDPDFGTSELGSTLLFSAAAGIRAFDRNLTIGPEIFGDTVVTSDAFSKRNTPFELLIGGHYQAGEFKFGLGGGPGLTVGYGSPAFRFVGSAEWAPAIVNDQDGDGVPDDVDACPAVPGVKTDDPKTDGCPPDRDGDGVVDADDACPDVAGVHTDDPKTNGCPPDEDGDGVPDAQDACPKVPGVKTDDPKTNGCPPDEDGDGVIDAEDACPKVPGVKTDDPKTNGCPPNLDRDGDGVMNKDDACPDTPGPANADPKKNGCPLAFVEGKVIRITDQVKFRVNSAELDPTGEAVLQAVLKVLEEHTEIGNLDVEGHTDNTGAAAYNQKLSEGRAKSVLTWLTKHGIDKARLTSHGYGMTHPIESNDTPDGRLANRRVEFHIQSSDADKTDK
jgi:outer membrane protein OmpA-like peptidoglycan-associated protein